MSRPLDGIRVLDFSRVLSGPHCGRQLADLGADVVKVEPPDGDVTRMAQPRRGGIAVMHTQQNCGKRNVSIDLATPEGSALALALAARCDVVLENYRPGVLARLGLGYEAVRAPNPGVVYCSISGYGQDGPGALKRAYAPVVHAEVGFMEFAARKRRGHPVGEVLSHADVYAALQATVGICAALARRAATGEGCHVDVSMAETLLCVNEWTSTELVGGDEGLLHVFGGFNAPVFRVADGTWVCTPGNPVAQFPLWCRAMGRPELLEDDRFATKEARLAHRDDVYAVLEEWVAALPSAAALEDALGEARLPVGRVQSVAEAAADDWAVAREAVCAVDDRAGGTVPVPRIGVRFSGMDGGPRGSAAWRGEHNAEVLGEFLGLDAAEVAALEGRGILSSRPPAR